MTNARDRLLLEVSDAERFIARHAAHAIEAKRFAKQGFRDLARTHGRWAREDLAAYYLVKEIERLEPLVHPPAASEAS